MEYAKRTWGKHTPFHSLLFLSLWGYGGRVGLVLGGLLPSDGLLLVYFPLARLVSSFKKLHTHGGDDGDHAVFSILESSLNLFTEVSVGDLDIILGVSITVHQVEETLGC